MTNTANNPLQQRKEPPVLARVVVFASLLLLALFALARVFDHAAKVDLREKAHWITSRENESYAFAVLGSSRSYMGVDIFTMEKILGQNGINLSLEGATYPEEYLALKLFLERNRAKHLILDLNWIDFDNSALRTPFHAYEYLPNISNPDVFDALRDNFGLRAYAWKYVPFFKNAEFNTKLGYLQFYIWMKMRLGNRSFETEFDKRGSRLLPGRQLNFEKNVSDEFRNKSATWHPVRKEYFSKILNLAKERGIKITLMTMPEYNFGSPPWRSHQEIISFYEATAQSNQIALLRFDQDAICAEKSFFLDKAHLNQKGALLFSTKLAERLQKQSEAGAFPGSWNGSMEK